MVQSFIEAITQIYFSHFILFPVLLNLIFLYSCFSVAVIRQGLASFALKAEVFVDKLLKKYHR